MRKRLFGIGAAASAVLFVVVCVFWGLSYRPGGPRGTMREVARGAWVPVNWRGQFALVHHRAGPNPDFRSGEMRGTWGTTSAWYGRSDPNPMLMVEAVVIDPSAPWVGQPIPAPRVALARPYVMVSLAKGCGPANGFGFGFHAPGLPKPEEMLAGLPDRPAYERARAHFGSVAQAVEVPYWFVAALTTILPALWLRRTLKRRRRPGGGFAPIMPPPQRS